MRPSQISVPQWTMHAAGSPNTQHPSKAALPEPALCRENL
jgi:hypothetical protein